MAFFAEICSYTGKLYDINFHDMSDLLNQIKNRDPHLKHKFVKHFKLILGLDIIYDSLDKIEYFINYKFMNLTNIIILVRLDNNNKHDAIQNYKNDGDNKIFEKYPEISSDSYIMKILVKRNSSALQYASEEIKSDQDIVFVAIAKNCNGLVHISNTLKTNKEFILKAIHINANILSVASYELKNNREVILAAVRKQCDALKYASSELKDDEKFILLVIDAIQKKSNTRGGLRFASNRLKDNKKVVMTAIKKNALDLEYASEKLRNDPEIVLAAVKQKSEALEYASTELKDDEKFILSVINIVKSDSHPILGYVSDRLKNTRTIILAAAEKNRSEFYYIPAEFKNDPEVMYNLLFKYRSIFNMHHASY
jgi:CxxC motif-containing protein